MTEKNLIAQLATKQDPRKNHARQYKTNSSADLDNLRTEIRKRLLRGDYTTDIIDFIISEHKVVKGTAEKYICQIRKELKEYYQQNKEDFLSDFHNKCQYLYNELVKQGYGLEEVRDAYEEDNIFAINGSWLRCCFLR